MNEQAMALSELEEMDREMIELGRQVAADCDGFTRHGRAITNIEMAAFRAWRESERRRMANEFLENEL